MMSSVGFAGVDERYSPPLFLIQRNKGGAERPVPDSNAIIAK
jgi:hypothetical protein